MNVGAMYEMHSANNNYMTAIINCIYSKPGPVKRSMINLRLYSDMVSLDFKLMLHKQRGATFLVPTFQMKAGKSSVLYLSQNLNTSSLGISQKVKVSDGVNLFLWTKIGQKSANEFDWK